MPISGSRRTELNIGLSVRTALLRRVRRYGLTAAIDSLVATGGFILADALRFGPRLYLHLASMAFSALLLVCLFGLINRYFGLHRRMWRYANVHDMVALAGAVFVTTAIFSALDLAIQGENRPYWLSTVPNGAVLAFLLLLTLKLWPRLASRRGQRSARGSAGAWSRALIVGAGETGTMLAHDFRINHRTQYHVVGFIDDDPAKLNMRLSGVPVLGTRRDIRRLVAELDIDLIAIAIPSSTRRDLDELISICQDAGARVQIVPSLSEMATRPAASVHLRELDIADLLGREEVRLDMAVCARYLEGRVVLVTGAAGSIGWELSRQLVDLRPSRLILLDTNETGLFDLHASLRAAGASSDLEVCIADISDEERIRQVFARYRPQVVFHAAAYKHVPLLESHPGEAIKANVLGTAVLCRAADACAVERFVFISSDKAVAAANNLGYSKRIGELLVRAYGQSSQTVFCAVRFGNVIGSRGSVVPTFERQIAAGGPVTVTHPEVTRFFMSIPEAAGLVIEAAANAVGGAIFMLDMGQPVSIVGLAEKMIQLRGLRVGTDIDITFTGLRPGEKLHEELTTELEDTLATDHAKIMEVIDPRPVARAAMEAAVRGLVALARHAAPAEVSNALRLVAQGQSLAAPAAAEAVAARASLAEALLMPELARAADADAAVSISRTHSYGAGTLAALLAARLTERTSAQRGRLLDGAARPDGHEVGAAPIDDLYNERDDHRVVDFMQRWQRRHGVAGDGARASPSGGGARASPSGGGARASPARYLTGARHALEGREQDESSTLPLDNRTASAYQP